MYSGNKENSVSHIPQTVYPFTMVFLSTIKAITVLVSWTLKFLFVNNYQFIENSKESMEKYYMTIKTTKWKQKTVNLVSLCLQILRVRILKKKKKNQSIWAWLKVTLGDWGDWFLFFKWLFFVSFIESKSTYLGLWRGLSS